MLTDVTKLFRNNHTFSGLVCFASKKCQDLTYPELQTDLNKFENRGHNEHGLPILTKAHMSFPERSDKILITTEQIPMKGCFNSRKHFLRAK